MFEQTLSLPELKKIFELYDDINDLQLEIDDELVESIIAQEFTQIITFHRLGFVFYYFDQLVRKEINAEQFLTMGDVEGQIEDQINPHTYREEHPVHLTTLTPEIVASWESTDLVIIDQLIHEYYVTQHGTISTDAKIVVIK